jgi:chromosome partitioning protein
MAAIIESCTVCGSQFEPQFRYQMEETARGFSFYCSQDCLKKSQETAGAGYVACDACAKSFQVELVSNIFYLNGRRRYACSLSCRRQLAREASGVRLGEISAPEPVPEVEAGQTPPDPARSAATTVEPMSTEPGPVVSPAVGAPASQAQVIAVFNHKGGTGKTTTSVSVAAGLAMRGKRVLLVDTDSQGNVGVSLNVKSERTLYHVVVMGLPVADAASRVRENLDVVASNESLAAAELYLAGRQNRDRVLSRRLEAARAAYDVIVLDCSPSLSLMNQNALVFADGVLVPVACDYLSLVGVRQVIRTVKNVNQLLHHPVQIWGVLPTFYDSRARICREALSTMKDHFGDRCLLPIRAAMKVKEAPSQGQTIFEYAPGSNAAEDYLRVVDRVLGTDGSGTSTGTGTGTGTSTSTKEFETAISA